MKNLTKYLEDKNFINWVFNSSENLDAWWNQYKIDNPDEVIILESARSILSNFRTENKQLSEEERILMFSKILKEIEDKQKGRKTVRFLTGFFKYAAVALIFFP